MAPLPTIDEMFGHALDELSQSRWRLSEARDWLKSDWRTQPTPTKAKARVEALRLIGEAKALIDQARNAIHESEG